jgi:NAD(P)-dependent dehydrogenase (short-subunit alcohol dehydrogenase family)
VPDRSHGGVRRARDVLVANAVRWPVDARVRLADADGATWTRALRANIEGTAATVRLALPHLARSSAGRIVLISSGVSRHGIAGATAYSTAKGALDGPLAWLKWEAGAMGLLVNIVSPGFTVTERNLLDSATTRLSRCENAHRRSACRFQPTWRTRS